ncbi:MAG: patatin-like phospholipase family protein, partial [Gammaproteobacteria bacterium]|nr:patatin-like phospholipase family protein [Gammaproteobacteria bacterium]
MATDMLAGEMVVLDSGDLSVAMRASMAVPGAFSPVIIGDKILADGGMMRNLPVDIARDLCADVVIAVSLASPAPTLVDLSEATSLAGRSLDVMIDANQKAQIATLTERDISIVVNMGDIGSAAFDRAPEAVPLGREAALARQEQLRGLALSEVEYLAWRQALNREGSAPLRLDSVKLKGLKRVNPAYVQDQLKYVRPDAEVTRAQIIADTGRVFALGDFERVSYRLTGPPEGPEFVRLDLGFSANGNGALEALLRAEHTRTWLNSRGGEWRSAIQLGEQWLLETSLYQPVDVRQRFFVEPIAHFERNREDIYDDSDRIARYLLSELFGQLDAGVNLGTRAQLRFGLRSGWLETERDTGPTFLPDLGREADSSLQFRLFFDTRNSVGLPTSGTLLNARFVRSGSWLGGEQSYDLAEGVATWSFPFRGDALSLILGGGKKLDGTLPPTQEFQLGGIRTFPGLQRGELRGGNYWFAGS